MKGDIKFVLAPQMLQNNHRVKKGVLSNLSSFTKKDIFWQTYEKKNCYNEVFLVVQQQNLRFCTLVYYPPLLVTGCPSMLLQYIQSKFHRGYPL